MNTSAAVPPVTRPLGFHQEQNLSILAGLKYNSVLVEPTQKCIIFTLNKNILCVMHTDMKKILFNLITCHLLNGGTAVKRCTNASAFHM